LSCVRDVGVRGGRGGGGNVSVARELSMVHAQDAWGCPGDLVWRGDGSGGGVGGDDVGGELLLFGASESESAVVVFVTAMVAEVVVYFNRVRADTVVCKVMDLVCSRRHATVFASPRYVSVFPVKKQVWSVLLVCPGCPVCPYRVWCFSLALLWMDMPWVDTTGSSVRCSSSKGDVLLGLRCA
jgi:hypothetical protein